MNDLDFCKCTSLIGKKFGDLTVIGRDYDYVYPGSKKHMARWICECNSNKHPGVKIKIVANTNSLMNGHTHCCAQCKQNAFKDLTGKRFGKLVVLRRGEDYITPSGEREVRWVCNCDCDKDNPVRKEVLVRGNSLRSGKTTSCGCAIVEAAKKHGWWGTDIYKIFHGMKDRCFNPNSIGYKSYGGRGITICKEWYDPNASDEDNAKGVDNFCNWAMSHGYVKGLSIERVDNSGNYCPENCIFADAKTQANNRRSNDIIEYNGESHTVAQWSDIVNIPAYDIYNRLDLGWNVEKALTTPINSYFRSVTNSNGETHTLQEWSNITGIDNKLLYDRIIRNGWDVDRALSTPAASMSKYITYNNDTFTMSQWDKIRGFNRSTISHRIARGWTEEDALNTSNGNSGINGVFFVDNSGNPYSNEEFSNINNIKPNDGVSFVDDYGNEYSEKWWFRTHDDPTKPNNNNNNGNC